MYEAVSYLSRLRTTKFYLPAAGRSVNGNEVDIPIFQDEYNIFMNILFFSSFPDGTFRSIGIKFFKVR
ncbi:MAG: hypothetical protein KJ666_00125 [Bacteroidetes bacterium]|nr:hypothetical protein [Bacteroidota bacterium]MBU2586321.1 hypothetical protein [Bacteroidota bacterium]